MEVGGLHAGEVWTDILGWYQGEITIGEGESIPIIYPLRYLSPLLERTFIRSTLFFPDSQMGGPISSVMVNPFRFGSRRMPKGVKNSVRTRLRWR